VVRHQVEAENASGRLGREPMDSNSSTSAAAAVFNENAETSHIDLQDNRGQDKVVKEDRGDERENCEE